MDEVRFDDSVDNQATFTYDITGYNKNYVLQVEPEIASGGPLNLFDYKVTLSSAGGFIYSDVGVNPYVSGGASYRFDGKNGKIIVTRNTNNNTSLKLKVIVLDTTTGAYKDEKTITVTAKS